MTQHQNIGIDLAKNIFFLFEINHKGKNLSRKKLQRTQLHCKTRTMHYRNGGLLRSALLGKRVF